MKIATWNVNGIRARHAQLEEWLGHERPEVLCLQEIKATPAQVPESLVEIPGYWCYWHGSGGYSGVALHVAKDVFPEKPEFVHPAFDNENRVVTARLPDKELGDITVVSVYVPNGGKDFGAKMQFLEALDRYVDEQHASGHHVVVCGDINIALTDMDVHPKERKVGAIGQRPEERQIFDRILARGLVDLGRALDPSNAELFTWWPPWRNMRQRNIGWRIDYILASRNVALRATKCASYREVGTSDHAPVVATITWAAS